MGESAAIGIGERLTSAGVVRLRMVLSTDLPLLLAWRSDREIMQYLPSAKIRPTWDEQMVWWNTRLSTVQYWMAEIETFLKGRTIPQRIRAWRPVGDVHYDGATGEIGLIVGEKSLWRLGVGEAMLRLALDAIDDTPSQTRRNIWALIHSKNVASQRLFSGMGFVCSGERGRNSQLVYNYRGKTP